MNIEAALTVSNIFVHIGVTQILSGVSFTVAPGERLGIIGPNGSGKTTLFNSISGFTPTTSGQMTLFGQDISSASAARRARLGLGRVFQNSGVFREMSVLENVLTAIEAKNSTFTFPWSASAKQNIELAHSYLEQVKLTNKARQQAASLSGGQMRLLEIIRALAFGAEVFLLDEPTAGVSPRMKDDVVALLGTLESLKKTILIIEHDIYFIESLCQRILVLDVGQVALDGSPEQIRSSEKLQEIYFGKGLTHEHLQQPSKA